MREPIITTETLDQVYLEGKQAWIKEVVEWIETKRYSTSLNNVTFRTPIEEWQAKLKEWGIV